MTYQRYEYLKHAATGDVMGVTMLDRLSAIEELREEHPELARRLRNQIEREPGLIR